MEPPEAGRGLQLQRAIRGCAPHPPFDRRTVAEVNDDRGILQGVPVPELGLEPGEPLGSEALDAHGEFRQDRSQDAIAVAIRTSVAQVRNRLVDPVAIARIEADVDADPDHDRSRSERVALDLDQDAAHLAPRELDVVGPLQADAGGADRPQCPGHGDPDHEAQAGQPGSTLLEPEQYRERQRAAEIARP